MPNNLLSAVQTRCEMLIKHVRDTPETFNDSIDENSFRIAIIFKKKDKLNPTEDRVEIPGKTFTTHCCTPKGCGPMNCP